MLEKEYHSQFKEAIIAIRNLKEQVKELKEDKNEEIAIIGMSCRFPGSNSLSEYWNLLKDGVDAIEEIPENRWDKEKYYNDIQASEGKMYVKSGGFIKNVDLFDNSFFNISPNESLYLDPQQRLILELSVEAIEHAGINLESLESSNTSVYAGIAGNDYIQKHLTPFSLNRISPYSLTGSGYYSVSGRVSYCLGLQGPSMTVSTACSSSVSALHLACQSLKNGESNIAIVAGANLVLSPDMNVSLSQMNAISPDGKCKTFDNSANGYARGEGAAVVVLKRKVNAIKDNDNIHAIIKSSVLNQDGRSNGFTAPNGKAQEKLLKEAIDKAKISADQIDYIEAHGTGTPLGDPIELNAIQRVFNEKGKRIDPLYVGSVKTNIGHTEACAGLASLIKVVLCLSHKKIPKNLHFETPNGHFDWENSSIKIPTELVDWEKKNGLRIAGVNSFGISGTNSHVIVEEYSKNGENLKTSREQFLLPVSAKSPQALKDYVLKYINFLSTIDNNDFEYVCSSAAFNRTHYDYRVCFQGKTKDEILKKLGAFINLDKVNDTFISKDEVEQKVVFIFPGQGSQWVGMGKNLYEKEPVFKQVIDQCDKAFSKYVSWSLIEELGKSDSDSRFDEIDVIQPVLVAIEIALSALWQSYGIKPDAVIGHSMGEVAAAFVSKAITLDEAAKIICNRSTLMKKISGKGGMAVLEQSVDEVKSIIQRVENKVSIAVNNSPNSTVLSGDVNVLNEIILQLEEKDVFAKLIKVNVASHSPQTDQLKQPLKASLSDLQPVKSEIPFYSTVKGKKISGEMLSSNYWEDNLRGTVLYADTVEKLIEDGYNYFIEVSPHPVLRIQTEQNIEHIRTQAVVIPSLIRERDETESFLYNIGNLYSSGYPIKWDAFYKENVNFNSLPTYPWQWKSYWLKDGFINSIEKAEIEAVPELKSNDQPIKQKNILDELNASISVEEKSVITKSFIKDQLASITGYLASDISDEVTYSSLGVDSMMAMKLRKKVESNFDIKISTKDLWTHSAINKLSSFIIERIDNVKKDNQGHIQHRNNKVNWLYKPIPNPKAKFKLFCFHGSGESAMMYHPWTKLLSEDVELIGIQLPGRADRIMEAPYEDLKKLIKDLSTVISNEVDRPYIMFGHSMGAIVLYEVVKELRKQKCSLPENIFVSAAIGPQYISRRKTHLYDLSEKDLVELFPSLDKNQLDKEFYDIMLKTLRSDLKLLETYKFKEEELLDIPIIALRGKDDIIVSKKEIKGWKQLTSKKFTMYKRKGEHNYLYSDFRFIVDLILSNINILDNQLELYN